MPKGDPLLGRPRTIPDEGAAGRQLRGPRFLAAVERAAGVCQSERYVTGNPWETAVRLAVNRSGGDGWPLYRPRRIVVILKRQQITTIGRTMDLDLHALKTSFDLVAPRGEELMDEFYARLFATAPAVLPLFADVDLRRQKAMLLGTLVLLRKSLRDLDAIVPTLRKLGARHVAYGAQPEHYPIVGEAMIAAMATIAGPTWQSEHESAWRDAFAIVAAAMLDGAESEVFEAAA
jgi:hemoglobin-like flavoprotein